MFAPRIARSNARGDAPPPRFPIQAKLRVGRTSDPLEHEADRVAGEVVRDSARAPKPTLHAGAVGDPLEVGPTAPSPDSFRGRGEALPTPERGFFERRLHYDFGSVRVHHDAQAADSALSFGARAYTYGRDIVFGAGEYAPGSRRGNGLLAHELTHVIQQGTGQPLVQRSALSDSLRDAWKAKPQIDALLARLSQPDMQTDAAHADKDIDTELAALLRDPDDLWVAQRIRMGKLGDTTGKRVDEIVKKDPTTGDPVIDPTTRKPVKEIVTRTLSAKPQPIEARFFKGSTDRRALVIAGVHGSEKQGIEVANMLINDLKSSATLPVLTTIIVPSLFPDNALLKGEEAREGLVPTNRNFPEPSEDLTTATAKGRGKPIDAQSRAILPENRMLIELMERFHPERIISIHGTQAPGQAGVFYDKRTLRADETQAARDWAASHTHVGPARAQDDEGAGEARLMETQKALFGQRQAELLAQAEQTDRDLSLKAAKQIDAATTGIAGRETRGMEREKESVATTKKEAPERRKHPSIAGNVGPTGAIENATWLGSVPGGVSLGGYAPARGVSVFTVEPPVDAPSSAYAKGSGRDEVSGDIDKLAQIDRVKELQSYANAVRIVLLGT